MGGTGNGLESISKRGGLLRRGGIDSSITDGCGGNHVGRDRWRSL